MCRGFVSHSSEKQYGPLCSQNAFFPIKIGGRAFGKKKGNSSLVPKNTQGAPFDLPSIWAIVKKTRSVHDSKQSTPSSQARICFTAKCTFTTPSSRDDLRQKFMKIYKSKR